MSLDESSTRMLVFTVAIFFFTTSLSGTFLPIYFNETLKMGIPDIADILFFTFVTIGLVPVLLIRITRHFERIISLGAGARSLKEEVRSRSATFIIWCSVVAQTGAKHEC